MVRKYFKTRMHSSRMRTVRSSGRLSRGCVCSRGVCFGGVSVPGGVSSQGRVCSGGCLLRGVSAPDGCLLRGVVSQHALRQTPPPHPCGQTDACKNITFATSLRTVTIQHTARLKTIRASISVATTRCCFQEEIAPQMNIFNISPVNTTRCLAGIGGTSPVLMDAFGGVPYHVIYSMTHVILPTYHPHPPPTPNRQTPLKSLPSRHFFCGR